jgi:hypothetical protein
MQALRNQSRPNDRHFNKVSSPKRNAFADSNPNRNRFPFVHYAIGNKYTTAFRYEVTSGILCEHIDGAYVPVIAFEPRFENAGQAFKWAAKYATVLQDFAKLRGAKAHWPCNQLAAQCHADLHVWGKAQWG